MNEQCQPIAYVTAAFVVLFPFSLTRLYSLRPCYHETSGFIDKAHHNSLAFLVNMHGNLRVIKTESCLTCIPADNQTSFHQPPMVPPLLCNACALQRLCIIARLLSGPGKNLRRLEIPICCILRAVCKLIDGRFFQLNYRVHCMFRVVTHPLSHVWPTNTVLSNHCSSLWSTASAKCYTILDGREGASE